MEDILDFEIISVNDDFDTKLFRNGSDFENYEILQDVISNDDIIMIKELEKIEDCDGITAALSIPEVRFINEKTQISKVNIQNRDDSKKNIFSCGNCGKLYKKANFYERHIKNCSKERQGKTRALVNYLLFVT